MFPRIRNVGAAAVVVLLPSCSPERNPDTAEPPAAAVEYEDMLALEFSYADSAALAERHRIQPFSDHVRREEGRLHILLAEGDRVIFEDQPVEGDEYRRFHFHGVFGGLDYYLVEANYYESSSVIAVHRRTGARTHLDAAPVLSPDRQRLVTANQDLHAEYTPTRIQIFRVGRDRLVLEWEHEQEDLRWGPSDPVWLDERTIRVVKNVPEHLSGSSPRERHLLLRRTGERWQLREEQPAAARPEASPTFIATTSRSDSSCGTRPLSGVRAIVLGAAMWDMTT